MRISRFALSLLMIGLLTSCSTLDSFAAPAMTFTPTETPLQTPTIAWFPPSVTPSPQPVSTRPPTPEMRPDLGEEILKDRFAYADLWDVAASDQGSAAMKDNRLTLAVLPGVYLISLRHELAIGNFYAEITAEPSLCRGEDSYGFLVRANAVAYYRFAVYCNGTVSAERVSVGTHQILQVPIPSGDAPPGAPGKVRIGVWAVGNEMRLFLNGIFQFSVSDSNYTSGTVGVFAHSAGATAVTVNFTDLEIQKAAYSPPTNTPNP